MIHFLSMPSFIIQTQYSQNHERCSPLCSTPIIEHYFHANGIGHTFWLLTTMDRVPGLNLLPNCNRWGYQQNLKSLFLLSMLFPARPIAVYSEQFKILVNVPTVVTESPLSMLSCPNQSYNNVNAGVWKIVL